MKVIKFMVVAALVASIVSCNKGFSKKELKTETDTVSYVLGMDIASKLKSNFTDVDRDLFIQGVLSGLDSVDILVDPAKTDSILQTYFQKKQMEEMKKRQEEQIKKLEEEFGSVKEAGVKFLAENKTKKGVITTASGLQYEVIKEGKGEKPTVNSFVKVHYHGTLTDGTVFDSSVERKEPVEFRADGVIAGWTEGLQLMTVGSKYKFYIPQELGYGAFPRQGGIIKPFEVLVFEVELLEVKANNN